MKPRLLLFILLSLLLPAICLAASRKKPAAKDDRSLKVVSKVTGDSRQRVALVIGNSSYVSSPLRNPANDARAMAAVLRRLGFEVVERTNLSYAAMNDAIESFGEKLQPGGVALFYYAGHGMQVGGNNYLIPVDARINKENEIRYKSVDAGLILAKMEGAKSDVNIAIMDACRDNPFSRSFRSGAKGLAQVDAPSGTIIAFATAPGKTAADGDGSNGVYTEALIQALETPGMPLEHVFKQVRKLVLDKTGKAQTPWESSSLVGDFYFVPANGSEARPAVPAQVAMAPRPKAQPPPPARSGNFTDPTTGMEFVALPQGFSIGKYEVTQGQWRKVMGSNPSKFSSCGENCPVEGVSWNDAQQFISKLNSMSGTNYRLPTEAEWEYACRAGENHEYCGSNDVNAVAWYKDNSGSQTHPVGQKQANAWGIHDMSGNVWEWCQDSDGSFRVFRGGSWYFEATIARAAYRDSIPPDSRLIILGFRLASPVQ